MKFLFIVSLWFLVATSHAALYGRMPDSNGDYQAYYDDALHITWLADANLVLSNPLNTDLQYSNATEDGRTKQVWAEYMMYELNVNSYLGSSNWRLPETGPINGVGYDFAASSYSGENDWGHNLSAPGTLYAGSTINEMAHLYYNTLGNSSVLGSFNSGPFTRLEAYAYYLTGTSFMYNGYNRDFVFTFDRGAQFFTLHGDSTQRGYVWAVHDGDIGIVPIPAAVWLFGSGLVSLIGVARRRKS